MWRIPTEHLTSYKECIEVRAIFVTISNKTHHYRVSCPVRERREEKEKRERERETESGGSVSFTASETDKKPDMGRSTSCFKLITCGGDSADKDDLGVSEVISYFLLFLFSSVSFLRQSYISFSVCRFCLLDCVCCLIDYASVSCFLKL